MDDMVFPSYSSAKAQSRKVELGESKLTEALPNPKIANVTKLVMLWYEKSICQGSLSASQRRRIRKAKKAMTTSSRNSLESFSPCSSDAW